MNEYKSLGEHLQSADSLQPVNEFLLTLVAGSVLAYCLTPALNTEGGKAIAGGIGGLFSGIGSIFGIFGRKKDDKDKDKDDKKKDKDRDKDRDRDSRDDRKKDTGKDRDSKDSKKTDKPSKKDLDSSFNALIGAMCRTKGGEELAKKTVATFCKEDGSLNDDLKIEDVQKFAKDNKIKALTQGQLKEQEESLNKAAKKVTPEELQQEGTKMVVSTKTEEAEAKIEQLKKDLEDAPADKKEDLQKQLTAAEDNIKALKALPAHIEEPKEDPKDDTEHDKQEEPEKQDKPDKQDEPETKEIDGETFTKDKDGKWVNKDGETMEVTTVKDEDGKEVKKKVYTGPRGGRYYWPEGSPHTPEKKVYVESKYTSLRDYLR